ncbi:MAG TPA: hypothetical protein DDZ51_15965 [Planctomycetaceae bacterium]|nr:hypothetical protein [Planctomycetaceae bacterium]
MIGTGSKSFSKSSVLREIRLLVVTAVFGLSQFTNPVTSTAEYAASPANELVLKHCVDCHEGAAAEAGLDLTMLPLDLDQRRLRDRWIRIHDRVQSGEMPPDPTTLDAATRQSLVKTLGDAIRLADRADVVANGRGPLRRLNRDEFQQNLRDVLQLPSLDIRDMLPEDREAHLFNKSASALDMSRVQLAAYLDAADAALRQAMAEGNAPPAAAIYRAAGTQLFSSTSTFGERQAMFFAKDNQAVEAKDLDTLKDDPALELALFRSAHWPYFGYPRGFVARAPRPAQATSTSHAPDRQLLNYRVRFSARAVLQTPGFRLKPAVAPVPMTFRARKPSGADVSGDVRATGGILDIQPEQNVYETTIELLPTETFEYSLLGLPVPLARNVNGGPPTYRYPPFPEGGQPGIAFQWLEVEGPIAPQSWPPASHRVLLDDLAADAHPADPKAEAQRLLRRFIRIAARGPVPEESLVRFENLIYRQLEQGVRFSDAMLVGYKAFLCSSHFIYLMEPSRQSDYDHYAIASRLSHFLANTRPDAALMELAAAGKLHDRDTLCSQTDRFIESPEFDRFVESFTDYWLNLRHIRRHEPDVRLYPEYRFDDYLIESMQRETRAFFSAMIRDNLPSSVVVDADFVYVNDRLAQHYQLEPLSGSMMRKTELPGNSPYGGLLTQGAILKVTASGTSTSPVIRGAWIMERLLGQPPPPPPPSIPAVEPDIRGAETIRELLAMHTKSESCALCHARFDPVGLALENFDILGGWQSRYRSIEAGERITGIDRAGHDFSYALADEVDASGRLLDGRTFQDIHELKALLASNPRLLARNLLNQFVIYATGTPVRFADRDEIEAMLDACEAEGYRVKDLVHALVGSKLFLGRSD